MELVFDIETDDLNATKVWCIVAQNPVSGEVFKFPPDKLEEGYQFLQTADKLIGHNIIAYDIPVINKLYPWFSEPALTIDTLLLSRLYHADMMKLDKKHNWKEMPLKLYGKHSLESYGYRLNESKGTFGSTSDWKEWSQEMEDYCIQDVKVTTKLWQHFQPYLNGLR